MVYYPVILPDMKVFKNRCECLGDLKNAIGATGQVLSLPIEPLQSTEDTKYVIKRIKNFLKA